MALLKPFAAFRPVPELAEKVAALPYDVMDREEAARMAAGNPWSFLHVDRAEIDLPPETDPYADEVYEKAAENLGRMMAEGVYQKEKSPCYYIYRQKMGGREQTGLVGCASIDDYLQGRIKKHELTRAEKEEDRIRHVDACNANTGPIFLAWRPEAEAEKIIGDWTVSHCPVYDFVSEDGIGHRVWVIDRPETIRSLEDQFQNAADFYIADGHHRAASAVKVGLKRRKEHPDFSGEEEFNYFLAVLFPENQLKIWDYNRVVTDLGGLSEEEFLEKVKERFQIREMEQQKRPFAKHQISMYLKGRWYSLTALEGSFDETDPVERLDVTILQKNLLGPVLGIEDPRRDERIQFVGGIRGLEELVRLADEKKEAAAFAMYPTSMEDLMEIADQGKIMPPKSTWFEPKLRSGLFIHEL